jgi:FolB domain-containing protein
MNERPLVTVGGLIIAPDGDILLVQSIKWHGLYSLPGGKVEGGETREEAFIREVWEETRLKISNLRFAIVQDCIFSPEFWQKKHFVMNDFIADLDPSFSKEQVFLNDEAQAFVWISPQQALHLPLHQECRQLIEWYLTFRQQRSKNSFGILGIHQHQVPCIIGIYPEERQHEQTLLMDAKVKLDLSHCFASSQIEETFNYVSLAQICTQLAQQNSYFLLENLASDILDKYFLCSPAVWAWICIKKPSAISSAAYAFVELERERQI